MKMSRVIQNAWKAYTASFGGTMKFLLTEICLRMICLAPLLFLSNNGLASMAWASLILWALLLLPARMNAAEAMAEALAGGSLCSRRLISTENYGGKLLFGLKRAGFLLLWGAPAIALAIVGKIHFSGDVDSFTVLRMIKNDLGGGDQMRGIMVLLLAVLASLLILTAGCAFHSGARHARAQGDRSLVQGHHGKVMGAWLASLAAVLPLLIAVIAVICRYAPALSDLNGLLMKTVTLPSTRGTAIILAVGLALTLPLLPLRSLIQAAHVEGLKKKA